MRDSWHRTVSYKKKIRGLVHPWQPLLKNATVQREVELERMVNSIVGFDLLKGHYMIFAKEINKLMKKFKDQMLFTEACIKYDKWQKRGLNTTFLDAILTRMNLPLCVQPVIPCEDWDNQIDCEGAGCFWYDGSCHSEPQPVQYVQIRYMRGDQHTINGLAAYKLDTTQSDIARSVGFSSLFDLIGAWGIRVRKRTSAGAETEITSGTPVALVSRTRDGYGIQSATWTCPLTVLNKTDSIVVRVYTECEGWKLTAVFTTEQLGADTLDSALWRVYYYTKRYTNIIQSRYYYTFYWGINTPRSPYDSRITNFTWTGV